LDSKNAVKKEYDYATSIWDKKNSQNGEVCTKHEYIPDVIRNKL